VVLLSYILCFYVAVLIAQIVIIFPFLNLFSVLFLIFDCKRFA